MRGKYSPTVTVAYMLDQAWFEKYQAKVSGWSLFDPDGYDSYGYNHKGYDRAGNHENDYAAGYEDDNGVHIDENHLYTQALNDWGFDGVKPVLKGASHERS